MLTRYNCALNRELLCFDIQTCMTKREQLCLTRAIVHKGFGKICQLHVISDNNLSTDYSCYILFALIATFCLYIVDLIFDLYLLLNRKHHRFGRITLRNAEPHLHCTTSVQPKSSE